MDVGIGLPNAVRGVDRQGIVAWAQRAEAANFSTLGTLDRILFPTYESLPVLAAAAAVTERIGLMTDVLLAPLRTNTALLAKQALTIDHLSGGRLVLGLATGGREDDYELSGADFHRRGRTFDRQLETLRRLWREADVGPRSPRGERPMLMIGGSGERAYARAAKHADGWTVGGATPDMLAAGSAKLREAWQREGRDGRPRIVVLCYFALGPRAEETARRSLGDYYAFAGEYVDQIIARAATDEATLRQYVGAFDAAGADELICFPCSSDPDQVDLLAAALE